jgi:signal transduction histidine kinase
METGETSILIIKNELDSRQTLSKTTTSLGYKTIVVKNGTEGVEMAASKPFDLIILDTALPDLNGCECLRQLKANPKAQHIPVIVTSTHNDIQSIARCLELGAEDYYIGPLEASLLKTRLETCLERKRLRNAVDAANQAGSDFVAMVSHEIRTPMTSIKGYTDLLISEAMGSINETQINILETIRVNINRMADLISDLTDISRAEGGRLYLELEPVFIAAMVKGVIHSLQEQIEAKQQSISLQTPDDLEPVWADSERVEQIVTHLISNACKYTPRGGQITVSAEQIEKVSENSPKFVHLTVQDTGIGIGPAEQNRVFEKFFRSGHEAVQAESGLGLGLSLAKSLAEAQGGQIWFESEPGRGTTFHLTLPAIEEK